MSQIAVVFNWGETEERRTPSWLSVLDGARMAALTTSSASPPPNSMETIVVDAVDGSEGIARLLGWLEQGSEPYLLWFRQFGATANRRGLQRLLQIAVDSGAALTYSDFVEEVEGELRPHPLIDHQVGSARDDFDFGPMVLLSRRHLQACVDEGGQENLRYAGWYDLRLRLSRQGELLHVREPLYLHRRETGGRTSGERNFDYVDPRQRPYQIEMEQVFTAHLRQLGAWLPPPTGAPLADSSVHPVIASVVIPVRNRVKTVADAVGSALRQRADFDFNVVVVDNHSDDGTGGLLDRLAGEDDRLVHLVPERHDLGIGGCWNHAVYSARCGRYAVQLDSDDLYAGDNVLQRVVDTLRDGACAAVVGSYTTVNFDLEPLPPGLVDHAEWTADNGHNNALRIHGLGAPRAFHVPTLRQIGFPNVSYGEDYAVMLQLSRHHRIGRILDSLYWCRRWEGNTDSDLSLEVHNRYATYKDGLRSVELAARRALWEQG